MSEFDDIKHVFEESEAAFKEAVRELERLGCPVQRTWAVEAFHSAFRKWLRNVEPFFRDAVDSMPSCSHWRQFANYNEYPPDWCWRRMAIQMRAWWLCQEEDHEDNVYDFANRERISTDSVERLLADPGLYDTDHVIPMSEFREGGFVPGEYPHSLENLRCVCIVCHAAKHRNIEEQRRFKEFVAKLKESQEQRMQRPHL